MWWVGESSGEDHRARDPHDVDAAAMERGAGAVVSRGRGSDTTVMVKDLLCGEALSPGGPTLEEDEEAEAAEDLGLGGTSWRSPFNPMRGSSFPSKFGETQCSPRSRTLLRAPDDGGRCSSRLGAFVELGEAMRVLQEREAQAAYRLTGRYVDALVEPDIGTGSPTFLELRRDGVVHIFKLVEALRLGNLTTSHAVAYLDRFLNALTVTASTGAMQFQYISAACVSIAAKMDANSAPSLASLSRFSHLSEGKLRETEVVVLQMLGWKLLGVTTSDFVDNMLAHLPLSGVPSALVQTARRRADELIHAILTEVEFLDFAQSIIGLCVMQCIVDETVPLQAALLMAVLRTVVVVDTLAAQQCHKTLVDLVVKPLPRWTSVNSLLPEPSSLIMHRHV